MVVRELEDRAQVYPNEVRLAPQLLGLNLENDRRVVTSEMKLHALWAVVGNKWMFQIGGNPKRKWPSIETEQKEACSDTMEICGA